MRADELNEGETVATLNGTSYVESIKSREEQHTVYNIEVQVDHVYHVGSGGVLVHNACGERLLTKHFRYAEDVGMGNVRKLSDGRIRYYGRTKPANTPGRIAGTRKVNEINPKNNQSRTWMESVDHQGRVRVIRPETGGAKVHYMFDELGEYIGTY
ncbi:hypothetical protein Pla110_42650 [Polystyrenella longa]|uniref:Intein C-terminal splicing domain-containing protein n=1 Tax=Polystyrenella longa TaxID=2528007 RepID=A0A518CTF0_9PLAN|nr:hypothetical protein Pla110_42650 [Polystyrenella longa]